MSRSKPLWTLTTSGWLYLLMKAWMKHISIGSCRAGLCWQNLIVSNNGAVLIFQKLTVSQWEAFNLDTNLHLGKSHCCMPHLTMASLFCSEIGLQQQYFALARWGLNWGPERSFSEVDKAIDYIRTCGHKVVLKVSGLTLGKGILTTIFCSGMTKPCVYELGAGKVSLQAPFQVLHSSACADPLLLRQCSQSFRVHTSMNSNSWQHYSHCQPDHIELDYQKSLLWSGGSLALVARC